LALVLIPVLALGPLAIAHLVLSAKIRNHLSSLGRAGRPVTLQELNQYHLRSTTQSEAASLYAKAFAPLSNSPAMKTMSPVEEPPPGTNSLPVDLKTTLEEVVAENSAALQLLDRAVLIEGCRFPIDYSAGWDTLLPHLRNFTACAKLLMARGLIESSRGEIDPAIQEVANILRCAASLNGEPDAVSIVTQRRLEFHAIELTQWLLNHHQLSDPQLMVLKTCFQPGDDKKRLKEALAGEFCMAVALYGYSPAGVMRVIDPHYTNPLGFAFNWRFMGLLGRLKTDELHYFDLDREIEQTLSMDCPARLRQIRHIEANVRQAAQRKRLLLPAMVIPGFVRAVERDAQGIARSRLVLCALEVERYRLRQHALSVALPDSLSQAKKEISVDPFDGELLRYVKNANGYLVYSIGPDGHDDGGHRKIRDAPLINEPRGDIVFSVQR
jgi:hypothetical protein